MHKILFTCLLLTITQLSFAQNRGVNQEVTQACLNYIEGFYEGDTSKLVACFQPYMYKVGYWKNKKTERYEDQGRMTYDEAMEYALNVKEKKQFPRANAPKKVEVLDVMEHIAAAKITAWWGYDYILLAKVDGQWKIEQVLWQGPLKQPKEVLVPNKRN